MDLLTLVEQADVLNGFFAAAAPGIATAVLGGLKGGKKKSQQQARPPSEPFSPDFFDPSQLNPETLVPGFGQAQGIDFPAMMELFLGQAPGNPAGTTGGGSPGTNMPKGGGVPGVFANEPAQTGGLTPQQIRQRNRRNRRQGGGGGGGGGGQRQGGPGSQPTGVGGLREDQAFGQFLQGAFGDQGFEANLDPALLGNINDITSQIQGGFGDFQGLVGQDNPLLQQIQQMAGGLQTAVQGSQFDPTRFLSDSLLFDTPEVALQELDPRVQAAIQSGTDARLGTQAIEAEDRKGALLADLFGRGVNQSTIAGDAGARFSFGQDQLRDTIRSEGQQQIVQAMLADQAQRAGLAQATLGANAGVRGAGIGAAADVAGQNQQASLQSALASLGALGDAFGAQSGALASAFGSNQGALVGAQGNLSGLAGDQLDADLQTQLAPFLAQLDSATSLQNAATAGDVGLRQQQMSSDAQIRAARMAANASRFAAQLGANNDAMQNVLGLLGLQQSDISRIQQGGLDLLGQDIGRFGIESGAGLDQQRIDQQRVSGSDRALALLGQLGPAVATGLLNNKGGG
jgi:hypothetical protein